MSPRGLTAMQRRILSAMRDDPRGEAAFTGKLSRKLGFGVFPAKAGGIIIRAYGMPAYFLKRRGLIELQERDAQGCWYRLTYAGHAAALRGME